MYEKIKKLCLEKGITVAALERVCGFGNGTIRKWDEHAPSHERVKKVADYFNVSVAFIRSEKETKKDPADMSIGEVDEEVMQIASEIFSNPSMRDLFSAVNGASADQIMAITAMIKNFKKDD